MKLTLEEAQKMMMENFGVLDLENSKITQLPEGFTVGGSLHLRNSKITQLPEGLTVDGWLDLENTKITQLPEGLTVGGSLGLSNTQITTLPEGLTVGGSLYLENSKIIELPEGLTVGGLLHLENTKITELPEGLTVGGSICLQHTQITELPEGLTVGCNIYTNGTKINKIQVDKVKRLQQGDYEEGNYLYADGILTHVAKCKEVKGYKYYIGKIKDKNVIFDGENYAHCKNFKSGIFDLEFKKAKSRGAEQYRNLTLESILTKDEAILMYRIITGACKLGSEDFVNSVKDPKDSYSIQEIIELTEGRFNNHILKSFFEN